jgi:hypothetical protein
VGADDWWGLTTGVRKQRMPDGTEIEQQDLAPRDPDFGLGCEVIPKIWMDR